MNIRGYQFVKTLAVVVTILSFGTVANSQAQDLAKWTPQPADWKGATVTDGAAALTADRWSFLVAPDAFESVRSDGQPRIRYTDQLREKIRLGELAEVMG